MKFTSFTYKYGLTNLKNIRRRSLSKSVSQVWGTEIAEIATKLHGNDLGSTELTIGDQNLEKNSQEVKEPFLATKIIQRITFVLQIPAPCCKNLKNNSQEVRLSDLVAPKLGMITWFHQN